MFEYEYKVTKRDLTYAFKRWIKHEEDKGKSITIKKAKIASTKLLKFLNELKGI